MRRKGRVIKVPEVLCLSANDVDELLTFEAVFEAVKDSYLHHSSEDSVTLPLIRERISPDSVFGVKAGYIPSRGLLGLKAGGFWSLNNNEDLGRHQSTVLVFDASTGRPRAFVDGNAITTVRTAAAGALGAQLFARPGARTLTVLGTGTQGTAQVSAILQVMPEITQLRCWSRTHKSVGAFINRYRTRVTTIPCSSPDEAMFDTDIIVCATPSTAPLVSPNNIRPGIHINAVGSDTKGKKEVDDDVLRVSTVFVDDQSQSRSIGELQHYTDCPSVEIGEVLIGKHPGRTSSTEITVFDSTGLALQDLLTADIAIRFADRLNLGRKISW